MAKVYEVREATHFGEMFLLPGRDRLSEDHPFVIANPHAVRELEANLEVEQASAAPGEKRNAGRGRRPKADEPADEPEATEES